LNMTDDHKGNTSGNFYESVLSTVLVNLPGIPPA
jgi:hypothetical protein